METFQLPPQTINLFIGLGVFVLILGRQLRSQPVNHKTILGLILTLVGFFETVTFLEHSPTKVIDILLTFGSIAVGAAIATVRAHTIKLWQKDDTLWQKGTVITAVLWIIGLGQHLVIDTFVKSGLGSITLLLYFGIIIYIQRLLVIHRAKEKFSEEVFHAHVRSATEKHKTKQ